MMSWKFANPNLIKADALLVREMVRQINEWVQEKNIIPMIDIARLAPLPTAPEWGMAIEVYGLYGWIVKQNPYFDNRSDVIIDAVTGQIIKMEGTFEFVKRDESASLPDPDAVYHELLRLQGKG